MRQLLKSISMGHEKLSQFLHRKQDFGGTTVPRLLMRYLRVGRLRSESFRPRLYVGFITG